MKHTTRVGVGGGEGGHTSREGRKGAREAHIQGGKEGVREAHIQTEGKYGGRVTVDSAIDGAGWSIGGRHP